MSTEVMDSEGLRALAADVASTAASGLTSGDLAAAIGHLW